MGHMMKRPILSVSLGLRRWFTALAYPEGTIPLHEIREIDPTRPGLEEFESLIGADWEEEKPRPILRLVYSNGRGITP